MFTDAYAAGIDALTFWQQKDGSFLNLSSTDPKHFAHPKILHTTFATALILSCLNGIPPSTTLLQIKKRAATFLLTQKSEDWSFNYWFRKSKESEEMPYPDDLDDTFCSLAALYEYKSSIFDGATFAKIITLLTTTEKKEGGPYITWLVTKDVAEVWKDVDIVVNSNIAYFLSRQEIYLPHITRLIEKAITNDRLESPYYYGSLPVVYFISRWYKGTLTPKLIYHVTQEMQKKEVRENALLLAFSMLSLLNLGVPHQTLTTNIYKLIKLQKQKAWEPYGFYIDPVMDNKKHYAGSKALTTAFCLLALATYERAQVSNDTILLEKKEMLSKINIDTLVRTRVLERFTQIERTMKTEAKQIVSEILLADVSKQITLLPHFIATCTTNKSKNIPKELLIRLGCASLYGWLAYTIYDNFLDNEGDPKALPVANISLRELTVLFTEVMKKNSDFLELFHTTMDNIDKANLWEIAHCRFITKQRLLLDDIVVPEYGKYKYLADRSMGHALAPTATLFLLGYKKDSPEVKLLLKFFHHYIIARQLDDDAHDFIDDLKKGHVNAVGALVIKKLKDRNNAKVSVNLSHIVRLSHEIFWKDVVEVTSRDTLRHVAKARKAIEENVCIEKKEPFFSILAPIEASATRALEEHTNVVGFLQTYK